MKPLSSCWIMMVVTLILLMMGMVRADMNDVDLADSGSDTSSTKDMDSQLDNQDPNLHNPLPRQGYGNGDPSPKRRWQETTTVKPSGSRRAATTTKAPLTFSEQSYLAALELGIIVGVAIMVGSLFMVMVGMEMLYDKACDRYREFFKKPKLLPDIERLHPAELVGTFSRYK